MIPHYNCCSFHSTLITARTCGQIMISREPSSRFPPQWNLIFWYTCNCTSVFHIWVTLDIRFCDVTLKPVEKKMWLANHFILITFYHPPNKLRECNVFSRFCLFTRMGVPMWPLPMIHWTSLYRPAPCPLDIRHGTPRPHYPPNPLNIRHGTLLTPSPKASDIWWPLKNVRLARGRYVSYWNVFL